MTINPSRISPQSLGQYPQYQVIQITSPEVFAANHIPKAIHVSPAELVCGIPPASGRLPELEQLTETFTRIGYDSTHTYVVCDDEGGGWAGRMAWTLDVIGHQSWKYLDGGLHAWALAGLGFESGSIQTKREFPTVNLTLNNRPIAEIDDIIPRINDEDLVIWDCRSYEEFVGEKTSSARAGHIPGASHLDWLRLMDPDKGLSLVDNFEELLQNKGITPEKDIITHCQTHHRSGLAYMAARLLGYPRIRAYHGSWSEWGNRFDTPVEL